MTTSSTPTFTAPNFFNQEHANSYDQSFTKLAPLKDALHLVMRLVFAELPADARILCAGAGTGAELIYLAQAFPQWRFTALEPAPAMLAVCRQRTEAVGIASRCTFHEGYIDSLPIAEPFDAATSILVSQFIVQLNERRHFFSKIAEHLKPNGLLISADLSADLSSPASPSLLELWKRAWKHSGKSAEDIEQVLRTSFHRDVAVLAPKDIEQVIATSGFKAPVAIFQTALIHAWYAQRCSNGTQSHA